MQEQQDKQRIREFVTTNFYVSQRDALDESTSFLQHGILDSTGVLELVTFVESQFGIAISDDELVPANFDSIAAVSAFSARKRVDHAPR
jgi:acyl carrier protein